MATAEEIYGSDFAFTTDFLASPSGDLDTMSGLFNLKEALYRRLVTVKGSIIHRPDYGVGIQRYNGRLATIDNQRRLALDIKEQFLLDPRVEDVLGVQVRVNPRIPDRIEILVKVKAVGYGEQSMSFVPFGEG